MRRQSNRLTVTGIKSAIRRAPPEGKIMLPDGNGLYLQIKHGVPSWVFRYVLNRRAGMMGLGGFNHVDLATAREQAEDARRLLRRGIDPLSHRRSERQTALVATAKAVPSFAEAAQHYIAAKRAEWKGAKQAVEWQRSLAADVFPLIGKLPVNVVDTGLVYRCLEPIWTVKPVTASRERQRIENILDWAASKGYRSGDNPARWKGHLEYQLANPSKVREREHHAALPYGEIAAFMAQLRQQESTAAAALEFTVLCAARSDETLGAPWSEFDPDLTMWTIPAERMKGKREHRVPLSPPARAVLKRMQAIRESQYVFPGTMEGQPLGHQAMRRVLRSLPGGDKLTVHGLRSSFSDWCAEETNFPKEAREIALAHQVGNETERAYRHGDLFKKRVRLAEAWGRYRTGQHGKVVAIDAARAGQQRAGRSSRAARLRA